MGVYPLVSETRDFRIVHNPLGLSHQLVLFVVFGSRLVVLVLAQFLSLEEYMLASQRAPEIQLVRMCYEQFEFGKDIIVK
jgi:hypothetical protein